ncbi:TIR-like protein FxsC [Streptomyces sp. NBC_00075]|uniref:TIR-like protein FxsC n=1 Tax=Streptomyces sp. NBC_00075 TaxID=2975641 RepID=UPI003250C825
MPEPWQADASAPYFFLSYAHAPRNGSDGVDRDMWVHRLFRELCEHISEMADTIGPPGFMDRRIRAGEAWSEELSHSLARCRVFVPLYSPRFFRSTWCGREWTVFNRRATRHRSGEPGSPSAVVPALWSPVPSHQLPSGIGSVQYAHPEMGSRYPDYGLYGLIKLSAYRRDYQRAVLELARRIVDVGNNVLVEPGPRTPLDTVPDAFTPPSHARPQKTLRITVAACTSDCVPEGRGSDYYGDSCLEWDPFAPESPASIARATAEIAERLGYRPEVAEFPHRSGASDDIGDFQGPEVMLLDRWLLLDAEHREQLRRFDKGHRPATGLMVPWNAADPDSEDTGTELAAETAATLPRKISQGRQASRRAVEGIPDHESFGELLPYVLEWAATQHLRNPPVRRSPDQGTPRFRLRDHLDDDARTQEHRPPDEEEEDRDDQ